VIELLDGFDARIARSAAGLPAEFNRAGVLAGADVHVALRLARLAAEADEAVVLAAAFAVRAPRLGHVFADLASVHATASVDAEEPVDLSALPWPEPAEWVARVARSTLVGPDRPLRLSGSALYLDRYWREEEQVARDLLALATAVRFDAAVLDDGIERLFGGDTDDADQRRAAAAAVRRRLAVIAGGPGTGKTTTVARVVALLDEQAAAIGAAPPLIALAAPTGKAAARLQEAVHEEAARLDVDAAITSRLLALTASTLHRLLGWKPGSHSRFRHDRSNRLPFDVVIVDETSMVSLWQMARLVEAVRPDARLVLVGDPGQLTSIEAGAVLGDIVGDGSGEEIAMLRRIHRFGGGIQRVAEAIRVGDGDATVEALRGSPEDVLWLELDGRDPDAVAALAPIRDGAVATGRRVIEAARSGDAIGALEQLAAFRVLCAHRRGPYGVSTWMPRIESWLADAVADFAADGAWYLGRPLLVTENDHAIRLYNGDTGVVVAAPGSGRPVAAFERQGDVVTFSPSRLESVETVYAMTIHKSQGSQFDTAAVVLPDPGSRILTRELLYTAVTRARTRLIVAGAEEAVRAAVGRPIARASGLRERLDELPSRPHV
jgi:exodeoxyribonuclease V alpha subunit